MAVQEFSNRSAAIAATIAGSVDAVFIAGYASAGDGGAALYKKVVSAPSHPGKFQSADGAWWEFAETEVNFYQLGAVADCTNWAAPNIPTSTDNYAPIQNAILVGQALGIDVVQPGAPQGKGFAVSTATPIIIPSNITMRNRQPGLAPIVPDLASLANPAFPLANGHVLVTGNPGNGYRAGQHSGTVSKYGITQGSVITGLDTSTIVSNVHLIGVTIISTYTGSAPGGGLVLGAIGLYFAYDSSVEGCYLNGLPNQGILMIGGARVEIVNNNCQGNGWTGNPGARNGISANGIMVEDDYLHSSSQVVVAENLSSDNHDSGVEYSFIKGLVIANNVLIGNRSLSIEGDNSDATTVVYVDYDEEVPADCIIQGNYIDGANPNPDRGVTGGNGGISLSQGNQVRTLIQGNIIRNITGSPGGAIGVAQFNDAAVTISDNYLENCVPASGTDLIEITAENAFIRDNTAVKCGNTGHTTAFVSVQGCSGAVEIVGNYTEAGCTWFANLSNGSAWTASHAYVFQQRVFNGTNVYQCIAAGTSASSGGPTGTSSPITDGTVTWAYVADTAAGSLTIRDNTCLGTVVSFCAIEFPYVAAYLCLDGNTALSVNSAAFGSSALVRFYTASGSVTKLVVRDNVLTWANAGQYPIYTGSLSAGAISSAAVVDNDFGVPSQTGIFSTAAAVSSLYAGPNQLPGFREFWQSAAPVSGTWAVGDRAVNSNPSELGTTPNKYVVSGWVCTAAGTPGTWLQQRTLTGN